MSRNLAYKIVSQDLWRAAGRSFAGTPVDKADGFIHLSTRSQVRATAEKWFKGQDGLIIVCVDLDKVKSPVKWEPSRNNELFPHIYGTLESDAVEWTAPFPLTEDGSSFVYPPAL
jgi:uncharacterized protein (DUF952 family)